MKYLRKFDTEKEMLNWQASDEYKFPNLVLFANKINYNIPNLTVAIQHINGSLYSKEQWIKGGYSNDEANGIAINLENTKCVIAKDSIGKIIWSSDTQNTIDGIITTTNKITALTDYAGKANTDLISATDTSGAAYSCINFTFPNGAKGYLPALKELDDVHIHIEKINELLTIIGGTILSGFYWSSTQYSATEAWGLDWSKEHNTTDYKYIDKGPKSNATNSARAFTSLT